MSSSSGSERQEILAPYDEWEAISDKVAALSLDALTDTELLILQSRREVVARRQPVADHQIINRLAAEADPKALGGKNLADLMATRLDISIAEAKRRIKDAELLGPRRAMTGEPLPPRLPNVAEAQARGQIGLEHVRIVEKFFDELPVRVDAHTRAAAESDLARIATGLGPKQFRAVADRLALLLNQDGDLPNDAGRARRRHLTIDKPGFDGMSRIHGLLDPETRATVEAVFAKLAAPGACNPDDETPCVDGEPDENTAQQDLRSERQRNHDALKAMGRSVLSSGELGKLNGLPCTIIVSTTLQELQSAAGVAVTAGGTLLPMSDLIRLASHSHHYLSVFDKHTGEPLYLGHAKRFASVGQRIVLHARDRGCTRPGCTASGYWCQAHHVDGWATADCPTDIDDASTRRRSHRVDSAATPRHRPGTGEQLSPSREVPRRG